MAVPHHACVLTDALFSRAAISGKHCGSSPGSAPGSVSIRRTL